MGFPCTEWSSVLGSFMIWRGNPSLFMTLKKHSFCILSETFSRACQVAIRGDTCYWRSCILSMSEPGDRSIKTKNKTKGKENQAQRKAL